MNHNRLMLLLPLMTFILSYSCLTLLIHHSSAIPYESIIRRLHLYIHETGQDYSYPDLHVKILVTIYPQKGPPMVYISFEDLEDLNHAQWNDCFLNIEGDGRYYWIEGRFTGAYRKTLWFERPTKGRFNIATYFDRVWFSCSYDPTTEEFEFGEYWK